MSSSAIVHLTGLAAIFFGALIGGRLASRFHVPRVTGYLLTGLVIGPSLAHLIGWPPLLTSEVLTELSILGDLALGLILLNIGSLFSIDHLRKWKHRIAFFSLSEMGLTFLLVGVAAFGVNELVLHKTVADLSLLQTSLLFSLFLGIIGVATAPAATLMVIREYEAEGPITGIVLTLVGFNNLVSVLGFTVLVHFLLTPAESHWLLLWHMGGPIIVGIVFGLIISFWGERLELASEHKILLLGSVAAVTTVCRMMEVDPLLASLILGIVAANSTPSWHRMAASLRQVDYLLYVAFFVLAGANLHIETLGHIGLLGVAYVLARTLGKWLGARVGAAIGGFGKRERSYVGLTLLAQAGVAIGLAASLSRQWPEGGQLLQTVVLGSVVVFAMEGMHSVVHHFRSSLGLPAWKKFHEPGDIYVGHIMRQNVETIPNNTPFNELLRIIAHSRYDRFPVVDAEGRFLGMINYTEIRELLFEPTLMPLVVAGELVSSEKNAVNPDQPLWEVMEMLKTNRNISYFPVVDPDEPDRLLGILSQNEVLSAYRRFDGEGGREE
jgi:Kef-type K+ transport system membrane component KefB